MNSDFLYLVEEELVKAREKHQGPIHTPHEAYGVIMEEVCGFFDEVRLQQHMKGAILKELVQIAAMCYRAAEDLQLLPCEKMLESDLVYKGEKLHFDCNHKGMRFRTNDPNRQSLGFGNVYKCLHGVEWVVTAPCIEGLGFGQFEAPCECHSVETPATPSIASPR